MVENREEKIINVISGFVDTDKQRELLNSETRICNLELDSITCFAILYDIENIFSVNFENNFTLQKKILTSTIKEITELVDIIKKGNISAVVN